MLCEETVCICIKELKRSLRLELFDGMADEIKGKAKNQAKVIGITWELQAMYMCIYNMAS